MQKKKYFYEKSSVILENCPTLLKIDFFLSKNYKSLFPLKINLITLIY